MESIRGLSKNKKTPSEKQRGIWQSLTKEQKRLQESIFQSVQLGSLQKCRQIFDYYNAAYLMESWDNANDGQRVKMIQKMKLACVKQNAVINTFQVKKDPKEISILLKGSVCYSIGSEGWQRKLQYVSQPGQILYQPILDPELQFHSFSIIAISSCLLLKLPFNCSQWQNLWKKRENRAMKLLKSLQNINQPSFGKNGMARLIPYFSECRFRKNELILSNISSDCLCFIADGQVQIVRQSKSKKPISLVSMNEGQTFLHSIINLDGQKTYIKCKSLVSSIYFIPNLIVKNSADPQFSSIMNSKNTVSRSLHGQLFSKSQKIFIDPVRFLKIRTKKRVKKLKKSKTPIQNQSIDLIEHAIAQMKKKPSSSKSTIRNKQYSKSAHATKRDHFQIKSSRRVQQLKKMSQQPSQKQIFPEQEYQHNNIFKPTLKSHLKCQSNLLQTIPRILAKHAEVQSRNKLVKKTKYKLLRYAHGHNLYDLNDYF